MNEEMTIGDRIRANADLVAAQLSGPAGFQLGFDERSVEWIDGFVERQRARDDFEMGVVRSLSEKLGCFLGEALRAAIGGEWIETEKGLAVVFSDGNAAFPLTKVRKHFANGSDDSIDSFYRTAITLFGGRG